MVVYVQTWSSVNPEFGHSQRSSYIATRLHCGLTPHRIDAAPCLSSVHENWGKLTIELKIETHEYEFTTHFKWQLKFSLIQLWNGDAES